jgi:microsomal dipeptidase-like Zn-dependent dipeptidase
VLEQVDLVHRLAERYPQDLEIALDAADVRRIMASGRIASLMGAEGGHAIDSSLGVLRMLRALGVRYLTLTHNANVGWADSGTDQPDAGGLTDFGRAVVREMQRIGMLVDLSHTSAGTMRDALDVATEPVIFSHSSAYEVCRHPRNVPDDVLRALAGNGGVCMVTFVPAFVSQECADWRQGLVAEAGRRGLDERNIADVDSLAAEWEAAHPQPRARLGQVADHVDHVREVAGIGHVGLGGDYDGTTDPARRPDRRVLLPGAVRGAPRPGLERRRLHRARPRQHRPRARRCQVGHVRTAPHPETSVIGALGVRSRRWQPEETGSATAAPWRSCRRWYASRRVSNRDPALVDTDAFDRLLVELERQFPLLHERLELTRIPPRPALPLARRQRERPVVLMAHLDVVPVEGTWRHPPFDGVVADGIIWGRGTLDDKGCVVAICEAVEALLAAGHVRRRTSGSPSAARRRCPPPPRRSPSTSWSAAASGPGSSSTRAGRSPPTPSPAWRRRSA